MCIACNHTIHRKHHNFFWSRDFAPALVCKPGETIRFECIDAGSGHFTWSSTEGGAGRQGSSFQVLADDTLGLVSESESGKTTIGKAALGLIVFRARWSSPVCDKRAAGERNEVNVPRCANDFSRP